MTFDHHPVKKSAKEAATYLKNARNIVILTGAGLSAASGIPTFRGSNGFWTKAYDTYTDPMEILTMATFKKNPGVVWQWHFDFYDLLATSRPNGSHKAILNFMQYCDSMVSKNKVNYMLVTQNIDNLHSELIEQEQKKMVKKEEGTDNYAFTRNVYEIHGNVLYMYCSKRCTGKLQFYRSPDPPTDPLDRKTFLPRCKLCQEPMKPHCMFFDEAYTEELYRSESVRTFVETKMDALIVIGTAL